MQYAFGGFILTVFYEPTDMLIAAKPFELDAKQYRQIKFMTPNIYELRKIADTLKPSSSSSSITTSTNNNDLKIDNGEKFFIEIAELCDKLHDVVENIIVTAGCHGIFIQKFRSVKNSTFFNEDLQYIDIDKSGDRKLLHYPCMTIETDVKSSSGAGDSFCAGFINAMLKQKSEAICVSVGFEASLTSLRSVDAVPQKFFNENHVCWNTPAKFNIVKQ